MHWSKSRLPALLLPLALGCAPGGSVELAPVERSPAPARLDGPRQRRPSRFRRMARRLVRRGRHQPGDPPAVERQRAAPDPGAALPPRPHRRRGRALDQPATARHGVADSEGAPADRGGPRAPRRPGDGGLPPGPHGGHRLGRAAPQSSLPGSGWAGRPHRADRPYRLHRRCSPAPRAGARHLPLSGGIRAARAGRDSPAGACPTRPPRWWTS